MQRSTSASTIGPYSVGWHDRDVAGPSGKSRVRESRQQGSAMESQMAELLDRDPEFARPSNHSTMARAFRVAGYVRSTGGPQI